MLCWNKSQCIGETLTFVKNEAKIFLGILGVRIGPPKGDRPRGEGLNRPANLEK